MQVPVSGLSWRSLGLDTEVTYLLHIACSVVATEELQAHWDCCGKWLRPTANEISPLLPAFVNEGCQVSSFVGRENQLQKSNKIGYRNGGNAGYRSDPM